MPSPLRLLLAGATSGVLAAARRASAVVYGGDRASRRAGPFGIAAALHGAAAFRPDFACGLATLPLFAGREDPMPHRRGLIAVPGGAGLGDGLLGWYA